jgi:ABC-type lipoprotein release transport system permease subunit
VRFTILIALRSLGRNRRRTLITTAATALAAFTMLVYSTLLSGLIRTLEHSVTDMELGDAQVHPPGYRVDPDLYTRLEDVDAKLARLDGAGLAAAPRLYGAGLAAVGNRSAGVELRGLDVEREARVTRVHRHLVAGQWLDEDDPRGVVLGKKLARSLHADVGDEVVILSQAADGSMANDLYRVRGVLKNVGDRLDRAGFLMLASDFRALMLVEDGAHEIALRRARDVELDEAKALAAAAVPEAEVLTWRELQPAVAQLVDSSMAGRFMLLLITYGAIATVILNATLMSVFERIRELGVMKAVGVPPLQVAAIVLLEAMLQAAIASAVALAAGLPIVLRLEERGLDLRELLGSISISGVAWEPIWYADVDAMGVIMPVATLFGMVFIAALYPSAKAALLSPVRAIYHR